MYLSTSLRSSVFISVIFSIMRSYKSVTAFFSSSELFCISDSRAFRRKMVSRAEFCSSLTAWIKDWLQFYMYDLTRTYRFVVYFFGVLIWFSCSLADTKLPKFIWCKPNEINKITCIKLLVPVYVKLKALISYNH